MRKTFIVALASAASLTGLVACQAESGPKTEPSVKIQTMEVDQPPIAEPVKNEPAFDVASLDAAQRNALYQEALAAYQANDYEASAPTLIALSDAGHMNSTVLLADHYRRGTGVPKDVAMAADLLSVAADEKVTVAMYALAVMLLRGYEDLPQDRARAIALLREASELGYSPAQTKLLEVSESR